MDAITPARPTGRDLPQRNRHLDSVKGVLIILVVLGHLLQAQIDEPAIGQLYRFIYLFHMPAFVCIAGMFSRFELDAEGLAKLIRGVVAPLLLFTILYEANYVGIHGEVSHYTRGLQPFWILWFLLSMLCWRLFAPLLVRSRVPLLLSVLIAVLSACVEDTGYYLGLSRTFVFLPFFLLGMLYGPPAVAWMQRPRRLTPLLVLLALAVLALIASQAWRLGVHWLYGSYSFPALDVDAAHGSARRLWLYALSTATMACVVYVCLRTRLFHVAGRRSLQVYVWHGLLIQRAWAMNLPEKFWQLCHGNAALFVAGLLVVSVVLARLLATQPVKVFTDMLLKPFHVLLLRPS
ncbi:MAG TPA: acyltransferase family protein [Rhodanobacteraceae bacterium]|nr:acyltransferase family protein [Rhodanobacteraceae bacterium]